MIAGDEDIIRQHASFKYGSVKSKYQIIEGRLRDVIIIPLHHRLTTLFGLRTLNCY